MKNLMLILFFLGWCNLYAQTIPIYTPDKKKTEKPRSTNLKKKSFITNKKSEIEKGLVYNTPTKKTIGEFLFSKMNLKALYLNAYYPLNSNLYPTSESNYKRPFVLGESSVFKDGGLFTSGDYNYSYKDKESKLLKTDEIRSLNLESFAFSLNFKKEINKSMPVVYFDACREFGIEVDERNKLIITRNNGDFKESVPFWITNNVWYELIFIYTNESIKVFLDRKLIYDLKDHKTSECYDLRTKDHDWSCITSANFGNGTAFTGYWSNLYIYNLIF